MKKQISKLLKTLEKTSGTYWNIPRATGQFLNLLIKNQNYKTVLEIGTSNGYSGIWLAEALSQTGGHLYTMESNKKIRFYLAQKNFQKSGLKNITQILGHAPEDLPQTPKNFDLIFLDATKEEYLSHFEALKNRVNKRGMILADNLNSHRTTLSAFVEAAKNEPGWKTFELNLGTGLLLSTLTSPKNGPASLFGFK